MGLPGEITRVAGDAAFQVAIEEAVKYSDSIVCQHKMVSTWQGIGNVYFVLSDKKWVTEDCVNVYDHEEIIEELEETKKTLLRLEEARQEILRSKQGIK